MKEMAEWSAFCCKDRKTVGLFNVGTNRQSFLMLKCETQNSVIQAAMQSERAGVLKRLEIFKKRNNLFL